MIDTRLKVFRSVATLLSFTKAANELFISQPAISKHIQELEKEYGVQLFDRIGNRIQLTRAGQLMLDHACKIIDAYQNLDFDMKKLTEKSGGELRIGASTTISQYVLPELIAEFRKLYPDIRLTLLSGNSHEIEDALAAGRIDLGMVEGIKLKNGRAIVNMGTRKTPGFRDLRLFYKLDGKTYQHHIKVGFSVDKIQPYTQEPKDFDSFWQKAKDELKNVPLSYTKELAKEYCTDKIDCYLVKLQIDKMGHAMYGYLFYPKNASRGSHPVVLTPPGAGIKTINEPLRNKYYAENGFIRFEIEIHIVSMS